MIDSEIGEEQGGVELRFGLRQMETGQTGQKGWK